MRLATNESEKSSEKVHVPVHMHLLGIWPENFTATILNVGAVLGKRPPPLQQQFRLVEGGGGTCLDFHGKCEITCEEPLGTSQLYDSALMEVD